jgi:hypothetical protein
MPQNTRQHLQHACVVCVWPELRRAAVLSMFADRAKSQQPFSCGAEKGAQAGAKWAVDMHRSLHDRLLSALRVPDDAA